MATVVATITTITTEVAITTEVVTITEADGRKLPPISTLPFLAAPSRAYLNYHVMPIFGTIRAFVFKLKIQDESLAYHHSVCNYNALSRNLDTSNLLTNSKCSTISTDQCNIRELHCL